MIIFQNNKLYHERKLNPTHRSSLHKMGASISTDSMPSHANSVIDSVSDNYDSYESTTTDTITDTNTKNPTKTRNGTKTEAKVKSWLQAITQTPPCTECPPASCIDPTSYSSPVFVTMPSRGVITKASALAPLKDKTLLNASRPTKTHDLKTDLYRIRQPGLVTPTIRTHHRSRSSARVRSRKES